MTPLYDESDRANVEKLNRCVADNCDGKLAAVPAALSEFASTAQLVDMLDFGKVTFDKLIALTPKIILSLNIRSPLVRLGIWPVLKKV
ncbi:MAG: hypothetical protein IPJ38_13535 [Dechloromonas sp.]|uniref:Uncharacterized protein n=1 Tax=Candidatus Dechloromonas phosphorivorans TaxID=2899244 RepID=A0A935K3K6_9RHOO|nr:hypothetical protein [Candidatus Dechloromonas phosphorivorans]